MKGTCCEPIIALEDGFIDTPAIQTIISEIVYTQGSGYDINQLEYEASGYSGGSPYRLSETGVPVDYDAFADKTGTYSQFVFEYNIPSVAGWEIYNNSNRTIVCIPAADTTTIAAFDDFFA